MMYLYTRIAYGIMPGRSPRTGLLSQARASTCELLGGEKIAKEEKDQSVALDKWALVLGAMSLMVQIAQVIWC